MQTQRRFRRIFRWYNVGCFVASTYIVTVFGLNFVGLAVRVNVEEANAETFAICSYAQHTHTVVGSDGLAKIAVPTIVDMLDKGTSTPSGSTSLRHVKLSTCNFGDTERSDMYAKGTMTVKKVLSVPALPVVPAQSATAVDTLEKRAIHAAVPTPITIAFPGVRMAPKVSARSVRSVQVVAHVLPTSNGARTTGVRNVFPYGQCTYWADQRYYQLHGVFVPWTSHANAGQWSMRAREFGWHVSSQPTVGTIIVLQGGVQGAYGFGHVGIVEQVLRNGSVIVSSMNWGAHPNRVTRARFTAGPGVAFISQ